MYILKPISQIHKIKSAREFHIFRNWKTNKKQHKFAHRLLTVEKEGSPILFNVCINNRRTRVFKGDEGSQVNKCQSPCSQIRQVRTYHIYWDIFFTSLVHTRCVLNNSISKNSIVLDYTPTTVNKDNKEDFQVINRRWTGEGVYYIIIAGHQVDCRLQVVELGYRAWWHIWDIKPLDNNIFWKIHARSF